MSKATPNIFVPSTASKLLEEQNRQLAAFKPQTIAGPDDTGSSAHNIVGDKADFSKKIYLFPESYNALRRELNDYWPTLWIAVSWAMAHQAEDFVSIMNDALDLKIQFDGNKVDATCKIYLDALRKKRGLPPLNSDVSFGVI